MRSATPLIAFFALLLLTVAPVGAQGPRPEELLGTARFEQKLDTQVPLDLQFRDETGADVTLGSYLGDKPVVLAMVYYNCPNICDIVVDDLVENLRDVRFTIGQEFDVVTLSIDPRETPELAMEKKKNFLNHYGRTGVEDGWHALTGEDANIQRLARAVGFNYAWDPQVQEFAHPSGIIVLTPQGKVSHYFYGLVYSPTDLRLGLVEASENRIGSPVDQFLLRCYHYNPITGKYTGTVMGIVRTFGVVAMLGLGSFMGIAFYRERKSRGPGASGRGSQRPGPTLPTVPHQ